MEISLARTDCSGEKLSMGGFYVFEATALRKVR
jgi:hypothetical protein